MILTGADILVECLLEQGVDTVFGYPGGAVLNIYDSLYNYRDKIDHILTAHEQGAAHAADGYARSSGKTGVCLATSGPGATNLVTGIATAYMDSVPIVAITGNVSTAALGRDSFQEVDITGITMPITKHNFIVKDVNDLADTVRQAFRIANSGRKGPVLIDITKDVTAAKAEYTPAAPLPLQTGRTPDAPRIQKAAELINSSKRPALYVGGGAISSDATAELLEFAEKAQIPVAKSLMALGSFPHNHPLSLGMIGMHGPYKVNRAIDRCDLLIVAGARFSDRVAGNCKAFAANAKVIHIDIDPAEFDKNVSTDIRIAADLKLTLKMLIDAVSPARHDEWLAEIAQWERPLHTGSDPAFADPARIITELRALTADSDIIVTDVGQHQMWTAQYYDFVNPRTFITSGGLGTMGFGMGAAIGSKYANPDSRVVLISGDGGFHMNLNELTTLASYDLPVVVLVFNNTVLGMVRQWQKIFYQSHFSATDPHRKTDFVKLADAFGVTGMRIHNNDEIVPTLKAALALGKPVVVDCVISPDANVLPMIPPGGVVDGTIEDM